MTTYPVASIEFRRHLLCLGCFAVYCPQFTDGAIGDCFQCGSTKTQRTHGYPADPDLHDHIPIPIDLPEKEPVHG